MRRTVQQVLYTLATVLWLASAIWLTWQYVGPVLNSLKAPTWQQVAELWALEGGIALIVLVVSALIGRVVSRIVLALIGLVKRPFRHPAPQEHPQT